MKVDLSKKVLALSAAAAPALTYFFFTFTIPDHNWTFDGLVLVMTALLMIFVALAPLARDRVKDQAVSLTVDQGGIRIRRGIRHRYFSLDDLSDVSVLEELKPARRTLILRTARQSEPEAIAIETGNQSEQSALIQDAFRRRAKRRTEHSASVARLARGGLALGEWLDHVRDATRHDRGPYREQQADLEELAGVVRDQDARTDLRAASAYLLLREHGSEGASVVMEQMASKPAPLFSAVAWLAGGEHEQSCWEVLEAAWNYLAEDDKAFLSAEKERRKDVPERFRVAEQPRRLRVDAGIATPHQEEEVESMRESSNSDNSKHVKENLG